MGHTTQDALAAKMESIADRVEVGGVYFHHKNPDNHYEVLAVALQEKNEAPCVVYKSLYGKGIVWVRNLSVWMDTVETPDGKVQRFQKV